MTRHWDIFCTVIDNYGDAGVCWRLARQLVREHGLAVRMWVDDLPALATLRSQIDPTLAQQDCDGISLHQWPASWPDDIAPASVVIEAFGCRLPDKLLACMAASQPAPVWVNLEYLSAEPWVESCHGMPSTHPSLGLRQYFFFPGFTTATGGLLREGGLFARRDAEQATARQACLQPYGVPDTGQPLISLFCYRNAALPALLDAWAASGATVLVADGKPRQQLADWLGQPCPTGSTVQRGNARFIALPFLPPDDYDRLLWACDLNFVRGEDSFVRAQWAARPFVWHIYPQDDDAHFAKLAAFRQQYTTTSPGPDARASADLNAFETAWNRGDGAACARLWPIVWQHAAALRTQARIWAEKQAAQPDLASQVIAFVTGKTAAAC